MSHQRQSSRYDISWWCICKDSHHPLGNRSIAWYWRTVTCHLSWIPSSFYHHQPCESCGTGGKLPQKKRPLHNCFRNSSTGHISMPSSVKRGDLSCEIQIGWHSGCSSRKALSPFKCLFCTSSHDFTSMAHFTLWLYGSNIMISTSNPDAVRQ